MSVKNDVFVNFLFHHLCQYGGWVCCSNERVKPGRHWQQSWSQHGRHCWKSTVQQIVNKVDCCHIHSTLLPVRSTLLPVLATNRQQRDFSILLRWTLLPIRSTLLPVCMGPKRHSCDTVEFNFVASVYWALERTSDMGDTRNTCDHR